MFSGFIPALLRPAERSRASDDQRAASLLKQASVDLRGWGHADHEITLQRAEPYFADASTLRCTFWCETCNVAQVVFLPGQPD